jgi:hypothetical protein
MVEPDFLAINTGTVVVSESRERDYYNGFCGVGVEEILVRGQVILLISSIDGRINAIALARHDMTTNSVLLNATKIACGVLALILFRWTPTSGKGIAGYAALFAVLIAMAVVLSSRKGARYGPSKSDDE